MAGAKLVCISTKPLYIEINLKLSVNHSSCLFRHESLSCPPLMNRVQETFRQEATIVFVNPLISYLFLYLSGIMCLLNAYWRLVVKLNNDLIVECIYISLVDASFRSIDPCYLIQFIQLNLLFTALKVVTY